MVFLDLKLWLYEMVNMKKLLTLVCLASWICSPLFGHAPLLQTKGLVKFHKASAAPVAPVVISFLLIPKVVKIKKSVGKKITLAALLAPSFQLPKAALIATLKHGKKKLRYSPDLKRFIKKMNLTMAMFKPLETYLSSQIKMAKKNPEPFVALADSYLKTGQATEFTLNLG
jgi:hypothetical protein